jgi:hypothetical protein
MVMLTITNVTRNSPNRIPPPSLQPLSSHPPPLEWYELVPELRLGVDELRLGVDELRLGVGELRLGVGELRLGDELRPDVDCPPPGRASTVAATMAWMPTALAASAISNITRAAQVTRTSAGACAA